MIKAVFRRLKKKATKKLIMAITTVLQSSNVIVPISITTAKIMATDAMLTVSKNADMILDFLSLGIRGFKKTTKTNDGKKIPIVAAKAPVNPPSCQPIKVADEKTGPGVN